MDEKLHIHDTCGVHNLHGMPAILAGVGGAIAAKVANSKNYKNRYGLMKKMEWKKNLNLLMRGFQNIRDKYIKINKN